MRKIIGKTFIDVFADEARHLGDVKYLAQGTLYPDVIESFSPIGGPSATIKSHHNVGGLPDDLGFELIEPVRELFKDEVRALGRELGINLITWLIVSLSLVLALQFVSLARLPKNV